MLLALACWWCALAGSDALRARAATGAAVDLQLSAANAALLRDFHAAFLRGDAERAAGLVTADFILHVPGHGVHAGDYRGPAGVQKVLSTVLACNGGTLDVRVPVLSVNGENAFTRELIRINRNDERESKDWDLTVSRQYRMKGGRISEMWELPEDQRVYDDYWSGPCKPGAGGRATSAERPTIEIADATSPENLKLITTVYGGMFRNDKDLLHRLIAQDVVVNVAGRSAISGTYHGWDGFSTFRARLTDVAGRRYRLEVASMAASDRDAWVEEHVRMNGHGDARFVPMYAVLHFSTEGGRITRIDYLPRDTYAWERFYPPPATRR